MRHRVAFCGFSEFEYRALQFSFLHPSGPRGTEYDLVDALADAEFAVVDADSKPAVKGVQQAGRVAQSVFVGRECPAGAAWHLQRPIDPIRILRILDALIESDAADETRHANAAVQASEAEFPTLDDVVAPLPASVDEVAPMPSAAANPTAPNPAKTAARAKARRARLADSTRSRDVEPLTDVLVLDPDPVANTLLCALLERFGFQAQAVATISQARERLATRPLAVAFLDIALDDDGVALLQEIRALPVPPAQPGPVVLMLASRLDPADRVRAALAGLGEPLVKPLGRGDVARALERHGVPLPADARRISRP